MRVNVFNRVENLVAIGEIAHTKLYFLLSECFRKSSAADESESNTCTQPIKRRPVNTYFGSLYSKIDRCGCSVKFRIIQSICVYQPMNSHGERLGG